MLRKITLLLVAIVMVVAVSCDWNSLSQQQQDSLVTSMAVEGWKNKGSAAVLRDHASKLNQIPQFERAEAIARYRLVWKFLDGVQLAQWAAAKAKASAPAGDCYSATRKYFPSSQWSKAYQIINRESGGNPGAQNSRSSAAGCYQIVRGSWQNPNISFSAGRYSADANAYAAYLMWRGSGWHCTCTWAATA